MAITSNLNIDLRISESGLTPDATNIHQNHSVIVIPKSISIYKKSIAAATVKRITGTIDTVLRSDYYIYIKNTGTTNFDVRTGVTDDDIFGNLAPGDFSFVRIKQGFDIAVKNLSSSTVGKIEISYWKCDNDATTTA